MKTLIRKSKDGDKPFIKLDHNERLNVLGVLPDIKESNELNSWEKSFVDTIGDAVNDGNISRKQLNTLRKIVFKATSKKLLPPDKTLGSSDISGLIKRINHRLDKRLDKLSANDNHFIREKKAQFDGGINALPHDEWEKLLDILEATERA